ncbi:type VI secretion system-associated FHA domain protein TagH [Pseudomonas aeruginosa]|uniref:type VI secretion system-associated FHA domain protein TagH n=1 Tax=Pseudomonas aeruginosa TaxID=287 RepID=UPI001A23C538|nr:type VI secretion system-associated FHA domain protein TagH [Pseudomonas aeruginosa]MBG7050723.1 type VI secretion system-associated FHA domain protein TagH [Pseudomonas aeruginosa]MBH4114673.1 type VI secretion system-associated FHA domain protein TagH [Pseudomonas aeruginosa]MBH9185673.1 type VI secretion system-associated FHA domain protein TagH [Pseudomonas aeruginosa]QWY07564.1 type VI secretion system-associated FHA domain protein TagH [Pseudomonas aeruginosa]HCR1224230.1 type VI secr
MPLRLTITSYHKLTPGQCSEKVLDQGQLTIGRGPDNDWVLPDPERLVSSRHCTILNRDGVYYLTDTSTNGVLLVNAGHRLRRGNSEPLQDGETVRLGEYDILVQLGHDIALPGSGNPQTDPFTSFDALMSRQAAGSAPAFAEPAPTPHPAVTAHFQGGSPLDTKPDLFDFLTPPPPGAAPRPDHVPAEQHDFRPPEPVIPPPPATTPAPPPAGGAPLIPADWDPFAELLGNTPAPSATPVAQPQPAAEPTPLAMPFADPGITQQPQPQPASVAAPTPPASAAATAGGDLLQAFLRGAGMTQLKVDPAGAEAQMEAIGRSYRGLVEGLVDVLRARASLKGEFRMAQTMIQPVQNNPLKFAPNVDEAMLLLLRRDNQAFMAPDRAVADSFEDLKAHQLAVMAGVQAAIRHLLARFEPAALEARFGKPAGLSGLLPGARQAQNWDSFTELYAKILREAEDDFQELFGREFSRAYEEHSARLRRS